MMKMKLKSSGIFAGIVLLMIFCAKPASAQIYLYFQDSPGSDYYEFSWMELSPPSELERKVTPDLRRFPVESLVGAHQGVNALRLKWKSMEGGNWVAIAAGLNWTAKNVSDTDSMSFWLQSAEGISSENLPSVFVEDTNNKKSGFHPVSDWSSDLPAGIWTRIVIPMDIFLGSGDGVDYTKIKTIGFTQNLSDGIEHTLYADDMRIYKGDGTYPEVSVPQGVEAVGCECHIDLSWEKIPESAFNGYQVERSTDGGLNYSVIRQLDKNTHHYIDWVKSMGTGIALHYRVRSLNEGNEPSDPSSVVQAETRSMTDEELLDMVQLYTFRYFWDFAHEPSGMIRERNTSVNTITSGGSGFGLMAIPVGIERGFISREEGAVRVKKMLDFLNSADRFHGAWSHWIDGTNGNVIPFSTYDNGGDLVETSYVAQGLLTVRKYFNGTDAVEQQIVELATNLFEGIEWDWYRKDNSGVLYWHWSPNYFWQMNHQVRGFNECAITYLLAIASPTHGVPAALWNTGWAGTSYYLNGKSFYGHKIYVGWDYGGPLFFTHYSFLGFDPRDKADRYTNYFDNNRNISLIHQAYAIQNPLGHPGYSASCWGMTASDDPDGYTVHEPTSSRDNGTISPTAALSAFPYTPDESMLALKHFYRELGEKTWGWMGFYDAFNQKRNWYASSYLAIDQGPILLMIENYRSQLLWDLFMSNPEIPGMLDAIGFGFAPNNVENIRLRKVNTVFPNPSSDGFYLEFNLDEPEEIRIEIYDVSGRIVKTWNAGKKYEPGNHTVFLELESFGGGIYLAVLKSGDKTVDTFRLVLQ